jgi:hypothetical protein
MNFRRPLHSQAFFFKAHGFRIVVNESKFGEGTTQKLLNKRCGTL